MSRVDQSIAVGNIRGVMMIFEHAGDQLPEHHHAPRDNHITIVCKGRFRFEGPDFDFEIEAGKWVKLPLGPWHRFTALEPDSRVINIQEDPVL